MVVACAICAPAQAQVVDQPGGDVQWERRVPLAPSLLFGPSADAVYSNLQTFRQQSFAAGGATQQFLNTITRLAADDLNLVGTPPYSINGFRFTVTNLNAVDVTARPLVRFYLPNGPGGGPGTLIEARTYNPTVFTAGVVGTIKTSSQFVLRTSHIWVGVVFDNNGGTTGATAAQLDNLAQGIFSPPTLGTSTDLYFVTTAAGSFASDNPVGTLTNFGGAPPANFGWEILTAQDVDLSMTMSAGAATAFPGGSVVYTITASNAGPDTVFGARVFDPFPASLTCSWTCAGSAGNTCAASGTGEINDATVDLAVGGSVTYTATCAVSPAATGTLVNTATIFAPGTAVDSNPFDNSATTEVTLTEIGPPTIAKAFGTLAILVNGTTTLTFTLTNPNAGIALSGVGFTDPLPAGLVVATPNGLVSTCGGAVTAVAGTGSVALVNGGLAAGVSSCTITVNVTGTTGGLKSNTTSAVTSTEGGTGGTAVAFLVVVTPPTPAPPTIAKAFGAASIVVNGTTSLTFTLANPNPVTALSGVGFTDTLPGGIVVATPNGLTNACGGTVTAVAGTGSVALVNGGVSAGSSCTITVNVTGTTSGAKNNTTSAVTSTEGGPGGSASASLTVIAPPTIAKAFGAASIGLNETTTLTFTLANPNPGIALSGVGFTDALPAGLVVATPDGMASTCGGTVTAVAGASSVALVNGVVPAGGSCAITVHVTSTTAGAKNNITSAVTSTEGGAGGSASASLAVIASPTIAKAFGPLAILVNGTTTLTFTLANPNAGTALSGVGFTDTLPAGLVVATPNGLVSTCGGTVTAVAGTDSIGLVNGALAAGGSCTIAVNVTGTTNGLKSNTTSAVTSTEGGTGGTAVAFLVVVSPPTPAPPTIAKAFGAASIVVNGTTTLTVTLANPNPVTALSGVGFTDTLPGGLVVATPNGLVSTCGGTVTAVAGSSSVALVNGGVPAASSCTITVNVTGTTGGAKNNITSAVSSTEGGTGGTASASLTVVASPTIAKAFTPLGILVNGTTALTFTLTNPNAGTALTGVGFTDTLPAGLVVATPNGLASTCGGTVTAVAGTGSIELVSGSLATGGSCTIAVNVTGLAGGLKANTTSAVTSTEGGTGGVAGAFLVVVSPPTPAPPTIVKAFGATSIVVNGTTTLTVTLANPNPVAALSGVGFTDPLPAGLVVATPNGLANSCGGTVTAVAGASSVALVNGGLVAGGSCTITVGVTGTTGGVKDNITSAVTSTEGGTGGTASASLAVIAPPTIAKAFVPLAILVDGTTTLTFTLTNPNAGIALSGVGFTDTLPAGLVMATPNGLASTCGGAVTAVDGTARIALVNGSLAAGGSCTITVNVTGTTGGLKANTTSAITSTEGGTGGTGVAFLVVVAAPAVAPPTIAKAFGAPSIVVNGTTTLTFTLTNPNAAIALTGVGLTDTLPAGLVVATPNGLTNTCGGTVTAVAGTGSVALVNGGLAAGGSCAITVNVTGTTAGAKNNTTSAVTSTEGGTGGSASASLAVIAPPTIAKAFGTLAIVVNGTTTLTFTLSNPNAGTALSGVGFTDTLAAGLVVATPNGLTSTCGGTVTAVAGSGSVALVNGGLAAGGSCTITVNVTGATGGLKANTTSAVTSAEGGTGGTAVAFLVVVAPPTPAPPTIAKAFGAASIAVNGTTTLTVTLANPNPVIALSGVGFTDPLPAGLVVATPNGLTNTCGGTVTAVAGTGSVALVNGGVPANSSCTITVNVTGTAAGAKNNTTSAVTSTEGGSGGTASATLTVGAPPTIAKVFGAASISVNGTTTLTVTLTNPNAGTALTGVGFTDTLPAGLVVATPNGLVNTCGGTVTAVAGTGSVALVNGSVSASGSCTIGVNVTGTTAGAKNNTTSAVTSTQGGTGGTASASLVVIAPPTIAKAFGAASIGVNGTTTLTVTLTNPNSGTALTGVGFTDVLPAGLVVATPNGLTGSCGGGTITATAGATTVGLAGATLAAGTSCVFAINVKGVAAGSQVNTTGAVTSANGGAGNAATASITVLAPVAPNLAIAKSHAGDFVKGQIGQYTITVSNIGQGPTAGAVTVTDTLPAGLTATSLSGAGWTCTLASLSCTRSDVLAAGASYPAITLIVSIAVTAPNVLTNTATVSGGGDTSPVDNTATDTISLSGAPIPTLSTFALAVFVIMVLLSGVRLLRRRPAAGR